MTKFFFLNQ